MTLLIYEGNQLHVRENNLIGILTLDNLSHETIQTTSIEVTFDVDANGMLQVKARDKTSGREKSIEIFQNL